jgi:hypothetical protein
VTRRLVRTTAVVFGWAGGKSLVASSYHEAKVRAPKRSRRQSRLSNERADGQ